MNISAHSERRAHYRYGTNDTEVSPFLYQLDLPIEFRLIEENSGRPLSDLRAANLKNLSVEGLGFLTEDLLFSGEWIKFKIYLPKTSEMIHMIGIVRWVKGLPSRGNHKSLYDVGVNILEVDGQHVKNSIYFDQNYQVDWSIVLESFFGRFRVLMQQKVNH